MANKEDIAYDLFDAPMNELTPGERAAVNRAYTRALERELEGEDDMFSLAVEEVVEEEAPAVSPVAGVNEVEFGRPGVNGVKKSLVNDGCTLEEAFAQTGLQINLSKEGFLVKKSTNYNEGDVALLKNKVFDGDLYIIAPSIDSSM